MSKALGIILLSLVPILANATSITNAQIETIRPDTWDISGIFIRFSGSLSGETRCVFPKPDGDKWYFIRSDNPVMDQLLSVALSAKVTSQRVRVLGSESCTNGFEGVRFIELD